jgi:hypothetical protein
MHLKVKNKNMKIIKKIKIQPIFNLFTFDDNSNSMFYATGFKENSTIFNIDLVNGCVRWKWKVPPTWNMICNPITLNLQMCKLVDGLLLVWAWNEEMPNCESPVFVLDIANTPNPNPNTASSS